MWWFDEVSAQPAGQPVKTDSATAIPADRGNGGVRPPPIRYLRCLVIACVTVWAGLSPSPVQAQTVSTRVAASADDAEQDGSPVATDINPQQIGFSIYGGFRFVGLAIPDGATIVSASIQFTVQSANTSGSPSTRIVGQAADNASQFAAVDNDITNRPTTTASVVWNLPAWTTDGASGPAQKTPDLAAVIQEIVDRPGWTSGNALVLIFEPNGGDSERKVVTYDGVPGDAPLLEVEYSLPAPDPQISSAAGQTFWVGKAPTAISPITVGEAGTGAAITAANDIRIRIPSGFNMSWDTADGTATITGGAAGKASGTVSYEDSGKTLVVDVTSNFASGDTIVVSDLSFQYFSDASSSDNLELEVDNAGTVVDEDDQTIEVLARGNAAISSELDQSFRVGDPPLPVSTITIRDDDFAPVITAADDLRVHIPVGFNMSWDVSDTDALILGTAPGKVSSTVSYENGGRTLVIDVLTDFAPGDMITIEDLSFRNFSAASIEDNLELEVEGDGSIEDQDDKVIFVVLILVTPDIRSSEDQFFSVGDPSTKAAVIRITDDDVLPQITAANDMRIRIPADFNAVWDVSLLEVNPSGTARNKVSKNVTYEDGGKTIVVDVLTDFEPDDWININNAFLTSFISASPADRLELEVDNLGSVVSVDAFVKQVTGDVFRVDLWPDTVRVIRLPSNGVNYEVDYTVSNIGSTTDSFDLLTSTDPGTAITVISMSGLDVSQGADPDSARVYNVPAADSRVVTVTYTVADVPGGTIDTLLLVARSVSNPADFADAVHIVTVGRPDITVSKSVNPSGTQQPGTDLTYTVTITNGGAQDAVGVLCLDSLASELDFKLGSVSTDFPAGVGVTVTYSNDGGSGWSYTPTSQGCGADVGYDRCVTHIRLSLQDNLSSVAPDNSGTLEFTARIQ